MDCFEIKNNSSLVRVFHAAPDGVWGYPTRATVEKGEKILELSAETIVNEFNKAFDYMEKKEKIGYSSF